MPRAAGRGPGVYLMLDAASRVIYVGKARSLRQRLASYVRFNGPVHSKTRAMLARVARVETIRTTTEKEALILEASLIKKHRPRYNVILRDDKNYPHIMVTTSEDWPRVVVTRSRRRDGNRYFGPYASTSAMRATLGLLRAHFPLRRCRGPLRARSRPCLNHQIGRCLGPCVAPEAVRQDYARLVEQVVQVLEGRNRDLARRLRREMEEAARDLDFERAARLRDQVQALERTLERQVVVARHFQDQDVFGLERRGAAVALAVLFVRAGVITGSREFFLEDPLGEDQAILASALNQYYSGQLHPPAELLLPLEPADAALLEERLADLRGGRVRLAVPRRGQRMQLMAMAAENAAQVFADRESRARSWDLLARETRKLLGLSRLPVRVECLDISNLGPGQTVGSLVCFLDGEAARSEYRHYRLDPGGSPDDYAMMRTVLRRRLGKPGRVLPDLLLMDGGRGQLNSALRVLEELGLARSIDLASIAKDRGGSGERIFRPDLDHPLALARHNPVLLFLMRIRDEAHRFGITLHRRLRRKEGLRSRLDRLEGMGPKRRQALLRHFGSLARVRAATKEELAAVPGFGPALAASLHAQLHPDAEDAGDAPRRGRNGDATEAAGDRGKRRNRGGKEGGRDREAGHGT